LLFLKTLDDISEYFIRRTSTAVLRRRRFRFRRVFVAQHSGKSVVADALPRFDATPVDASRIPDAFFAAGTVPSGQAPALVRLGAESGRSVAVLKRV
jgi:hypothetical protein